MFAITNNKQYRRGFGVYFVYIIYGFIFRYLFIYFHVLSTAIPTVKEGWFRKVLILEQRDSTRFHEHASYFLKKKNK